MRAVEDPPIRGPIVMLLKITAHFFLELGRRDCWGYRAILAQKVKNLERDKDDPCGAKPEPQLLTMSPLLSREFPVQVWLHERTYRLSSEKPQKLRLSDFSCVSSCRPAQQLDKSALPMNIRKTALG